MEITQHEKIKKYGKHCGHCNRNTLLPYEYEFTCFTCGYNVIKGKHDRSKIQRKKPNSNICSKYAEQKFFCICVDVNKNYESNGYDNLYEILSTL